MSAPGPHEKGDGRIADEAKIFREMIFKEGEYINHRITWLVTLQGLLFTALGFAWGGGKNLIAVLAAVGILSSLSIGLVLVVGTMAAHSLVRDWGKLHPDYEGPPVVGRGYTHPALRWLLPWFLLPVLFALAWVGVVIVNTWFRA